jgi:O-antigen/teichoic acid export membrane protein
MGGTDVTPSDDVAGDRPRDSTPKPARVRTLILLMGAVLGRGRALSTSALNQVVSSGANFALGLVLVRALSEGEYGTYGLGYAACYLFLGVGNALLLTQFVVRTADKEVGRRAVFAAEVLAAVGLLGVAAITTSVVGSFIAWSLFRVEASALAYLLAVVVASVASVAREYFVRQAYTDSFVGRALAVTGAAAFTLFAVVALTVSMGIALTAASALYVYAASQAAGSVVGLLLSRLPVRAVRWGGVVATIRECWTGGSWAVAGVAIWWAQSQGYAYFAALMLGTAASGRANAARLLLTPFLLLVTSANQLAMPRLAELRVRSPELLTKAVLALAAVFVVLSSAYSALILGASSTVIPAVLGEKYQGLFGLVAAWCVALVAMLVRDCAGTMLQAMKEFRALTLATAVSAIVSVVAVVLLIPRWGVEGAVLSTAIGDAVMAAIIWPLAMMRARFVQTARES